ncbi:MAG: hypothetical protein LBT98_03435 [Puniceicoccales bacterium]|jgi:hypothetical protein|nr:hypothetical protein [Puniceicoccales bacterium]
MAEFYQRHLDPSPASDLSAGSLTLAKGFGDIAQSLNEIRVVQQENENLLRRSEFQNFARREALAAYEENPVDLDAYRASFRKRLESYQVSLGDAVAYGTIVNNTEGQFYSTILSGKDRALRESLKYNALDTAEGFIKTGIRIGDGTIQSPDPALEIYENLTNATGMLMSTAADGSQLFTPEEIANATDSWTLQILQGRQAVDLNGNISLEALARVADPNFDYTVTVPNPVGEPLTFRTSDLSEGRRNQFQTASMERVAALLQKESDAAALDQAQRLWIGEEIFLPGNSADKKALELLANVQVADSPIAFENLQLHMDNCRSYVERFELLPEPYARTILSLVNADSPHAAVMGAKIIGSLMEISPDTAKTMAKSFDDATLLRAKMLHGLIQGGTPLTDALVAVKSAMAMDVHALQTKLRERTTSEKSRNKFYGSDVNAKTYGHDGVDIYRRMVDAFFLTNGGNRDSAVAVAKARIDSEFAETKIGADGDWHMPLFGRKRRKFRNTPEAVFGKNSSKIINNVLRAAAPEISLKTGIPCDLAHIMLVATPATDWAVENGENPSWVIARKNDDGSTIFYFDAKTGNPLVFSLDEGVRQEIYIADLEDVAAVDRWSKLLSVLQASDPYTWNFAGMEIFFPMAIAHVEELGISDALVDMQMGLGEDASSSFSTISQFFHNLWATHRAKKREGALGRSNLKTKTPPKAMREREAMP